MPGLPGTQTGRGLNSAGIIGFHNVLNEGLRGDGLGSDGTALTALFTALPSAGGVVVLPPATYNLDSSPSVPNNVTLIICAGVTLTGAGALSAAAGGRQRRHHHPQRSRFVSAERNPEGQFPGGELMAASLCEQYATVWPDDGSRQIASAICTAESGGNPQAHCASCAGVPEDSRGLWQINTRAWTNFDPNALFDPAYN